jgi:branched-chain amino acid transport system permease protein
MNDFFRFRYMGPFFFIVLIFLAPAFIKNQYYIHMLITVFFNILFASSLRLVMTTGLVPFCHAVFVAIGGYVSGVLVMKFGLSMWMGLPVAVGAVMAITIPLGFVLLRLKGAYFFLASFALGEVILLIFNLTQFFGGSRGLFNYPPPNPILIPGLFSIEFGSKTSYYYLTLVLTLVTLLIAYEFEKGRLGKAWGAIDQSDHLAESIGINVMLQKVIAFSIGSCMAGVAGVFNAHYLTSINPQRFAIFTMVNFLVFVVVGGRKKFVGPLIGAALLTLLAEFLGLYRKLLLYQSLVYSIVLMLIVLFLPDGVVSLPEAAFSRFRQRRGERNG